jgi:hypothetical protein
VARFEIADPSLEEVFIGESASDPVTRTTWRRRRAATPHRRPRCERQRAIDPAGTGPPSQRDADRGPRIPHRVRPGRSSRPPRSWRSSRSVWRWRRSACVISTAARSSGSGSTPTPGPRVCAVAARHVPQHPARRRRRHEMGEAVPAGPIGQPRPASELGDGKLRPCSWPAGPPTVRSPSSPYAGVGVEPAQPTDRVRVGRRRDPRLASAPPDRRRRRSFHPPTFVVVSTTGRPPAASGRPAADRQPIRAGDRAHRAHLRHADRLRMWVATSVAAEKSTRSWSC